MIPAIRVFGGERFQASGRNEPRSTNEPAGLRREFVLERLAAQRSAAGAVCSQAPGALAHPEQGGKPWYTGSILWWRNLAGLELSIRSTRTFRQLRDRLHETEFFEKTT